MHALHFDLGQLKETGALHLQETLPAAAFEDALAGVGRLSGPLEVELDLTYQAGRIGYQGRVRGQWELECVRCLAHPRAEYSTTLSGLLEEGEAGKQAFEEVRQALILAAPSTYHCREDCKGLCPRCGEDLNKGVCRCKPS